MIRELKLSNFRLFSDEVTVRFRPITILIGTNNSGKSSIIKFLMMLKQSTVNVKSFLAANGSEVELGRFYDLKNKVVDLPNLSFSLVVNDNTTPDDNFFDYLKKRELSWQDKKRTYKFKVNMAYTLKDLSSGTQEIIFNVEDNYLGEELEISTNSTMLNPTDEQKKSIGTKKVKKEVSEFITKTCIERLKYDIQSLDHLSATREELKKIALIDSPVPSKYVGKTGEHTISQLWNLWNEEILNEKDKRKFLLRHTRKVLGVDEIKLKVLGNLAVIFSAKNKLTDAKINISDFGFGVSQCLPVFVQGLLMPPKSQLIIEQPEAQVHPTAQIEMGSFFVDLWNEHEVGSIIETHSSNILLRIRHLIKQGKISHEDVSVAYFKCDKKTPEIVNININEDGTIQKGLPMEFFGGDLIETLKMGPPSYEGE